MKKNLWDNQKDWQCCLVYRYTMIINQLIIECIHFQVWYINWSMNHSDMKIESKKMFECSKSNELIIIGISIPVQLPWLIQDDSILKWTNKNVAFDHETSVISAHDNFHYIMNYNVNDDSINFFYVYNKFWCMIVVYLNLNLASIKLLDRQLTIQTYSNHRSKIFFSRVIDGFVSIWNQRVNLAYRE